MNDEVAMNMPRRDSYCFDCLAQRIVDKLRVELALSDPENHKRLSTETSALLLQYQLNKEAEQYRRASGET